MAPADLNGRPCEAHDCSRPVYALSRCRVHYDRARYEERIAQDREAAGAAEREQAIDCELERGHPPAGHESAFENEDDRRRAWQERKDRLMERYLSPPYVALRPHAWWDYEAGRPQYVLPAPDYSTHDLAEITRLDHAREVESIAWMARHGHLTGRELDVIARKGHEAKARIGTPAEQKAALSPDFGGDKLDAALADAVAEAVFDGSARGQRSAPSIRSSSADHGP
jgi:hypothetical protein